MKTYLLAVSAFALVAGFAPLSISAAQTSVITRAQSGAVSATPVPLTDAARTDALTRASAALNRVRNIQGRFGQTAPDGGRTVGQFYLSRGQGNRMGRLRFEYDPPTQFLVVADGTNVATIDRALRSTTRVGIGETPLQYLLKPNINLDRDTRVTAVARIGTDLAITVRDRANRVDGALTLYLDPQTYALKAWDVMDAARATTRVTLTESRTAQSLSPRLFVIEDLSPRRR
jgi:outer membrane lipoprotein-sorting protein